MKPVVEMPRIIEDPPQFHDDEGCTPTWSETSAAIGFIVLDAIAELFTYKPRSDRVAPRSQDC